MFMGTVPSAVATISVQLPLQKMGVVLLEMLMIVSSAAAIMPVRFPLLRPAVSYAMDTDVLSLAAITPVWFVLLLVMNLRVALRGI